MKAKDTFVKAIAGVFVAILFWCNNAVAQVVLKDLSTYSQNFNTLPAQNNTATWLDNTTLNGWYISTGNGVSILASQGGLNQAGVMSYGAALDSDRGLGNASLSTYYGLRLKNNTGHTLAHFTIQYTMEVWRRAPGNRIVSSTVTFQKNTSAVTGGTWNQVVNGSTQWRSGGGGAAVLNGNNAANRFTHVFILPVTLAPGEEVMLRWEQAAHKDYELALDDVSVTPGINAAPATVFYSRPDVLSVKYLNNLDNWDNDPVGNGTQQPASFSNATFVITGRAHSTINGNWVLGQNAKVVVSQGEMLVPAAYAVTGEIDVAANATLTLDNTSLPKLGMLDANSTVVFNSAAVLPAAEFGNLIVNNGSKQLSDDTQIKNALVLNGSLVLNSFNLEIGSNGQVQNASAANYIVTNGAGRLEMHVSNNNREVLFPVGSLSAYLPIRISQTTAATADVFRVKAADGVFASYDAEDVPAGASLTGGALNKTWFVDEEVKGGSDVSLTIPVALSLLNGALLPGFDLQKVVISHFENNKWDEPFVDPALLLPLSGGALGYEVSRHGITTFSPFALKNGNNAPLPVALLGFTAKRQKNGIVCNWKTAREINSDFFTVERSIDGRNFEQTGSMKGKGTTSQVSEYTFTDLAAPQGLVYYRLRQTDLDGTVAFLGIVVVGHAEEKTVPFTLYPNPTAGGAMLQSLGNASAEMFSVSMFNSQGKLVGEQSVSGVDLSKGLLLELNGQPAGLYLLKIVCGKTVEVLRLLRN